MNKNRIINLTCFALGLVLNALGIRLIVFADFGTYPIDGVAIAFHNMFGLTVGTWLNIDSIVLVLAAALIVKKKPDFYCFGVSILFGLLYDAWMVLLFDKISLYEISVGLRAVLFISGAVINAVGASIYLCPGWPVSALDNLMLSVRDRFKLSLQKSRLLMEAGIALLAILLGGPLGLGTLILVLLFSSVLEIIHNYMLKKYKAVIKPGIHSSDPVH